MATLSGQTRRREANGRTRSGDQQYRSREISACDILILLSQIFNLLVLNPYLKINNSFRYTLLQIYKISTFSKPVLYVVNPLPLHPHANFKIQSSVFAELMVKKKSLKSTDAKKFKLELFCSSRKQHGVHPRPLLDSSWQVASTQLATLLIPKSPKHNLTFPT